MRKKINIERSWKPRIRQLTDGIYAALQPEAGSWKWEDGSLKKYEGLGMKDYSLVHHRYSLSQEDNSLENFYDSIDQKPSAQGQKGSSLVLHRDSLGKQGNSLENLDDSLWNNVSGQGQKDNFLSQMDVSLGNNECRFTNNDCRSEAKDEGLRIKDELAGSNSQSVILNLIQDLKKPEVQKNAEYRLTINDLGFTGSNRHPFETKNINEIQNKLKAPTRGRDFRCASTQSSQPRRKVGISAALQLAAKDIREPKIKPDFALVAEEGTVTNFLKQSTAYEK